MVLIIVAAMIVWMGYGQHQGAPKPAGKALQISFRSFKERENPFSNYYLIPTYENCQQMKEVALKQFPSAVTISFY